MVAESPKGMTQTLDERNSTRACWAHSAHGHCAIANKIHLFPKDPRDLKNDSFVTFCVRKIPCVDMGSSRVPQSQKMGELHQNEDLDLMQRDHLDRFESF